MSIASLSVPLSLSNGGQRLSQKGSEQWASSGTRMCCIAFERLRKTSEESHPICGYSKLRCLGDSVRSAWAPRLLCIFARGFACVSHLDETSMAEICILLAAEGSLSCICSGLPWICLEGIFSSHLDYD